MINALTRLSTWKLILPLFILFALFPFFIFPKYQARMTEAAGTEVAPLDTRFNYSDEEVRSDFEKLNTRGREVYSIVVGRVDMLFPVAYGAFFVFLLAYLLRQIFGPSRWMLLAFLPVVGVVFDYLENFSILRLLHKYPHIAAVDVTKAETMTQLKHGFLFLSVAVMLLVGITVLMRKIFYRNTVSSVR